MRKDGVVRKLRAYWRIPNKAIMISAVRRACRKTRASKSDLQEHLRATYRWICAAQDASPDDGVAASYNLWKGWNSSYPETTGYIIPSFLAYARVMDEPAAEDRAVRMADWEIEVQLPAGAVRSGLIGEKVGPAVFNTGQVLLGWTAAYQVTQDSRYATAVEKAASWLLATQEEDGTWRKDLSLVTSSHVQTYNTRSAWALAQAGVVFENTDWVHAARRNCDWALGQQAESGWFANNTFEPSEKPLLHTIAYAIEGFLGMGLLLHDNRYTDAAIRATNGLLARIQKDGRPYGRYGPGWQPCAASRCVTGDAQFAGVLLRLCLCGRGSDKYEHMAQRIIQDVCSQQDMNPRHSQTCGGVAGSHPIWGGYQQYRYPNWAAKFHLDALLLLLHQVDPHEAVGTRGIPSHWTRGTPRIMNAKSQHCFNPAEPG